MVKTNPGLDKLPLAKIVSGGELSRISLALQTILVKQENIPTLIFFIFFLMNFNTLNKANQQYNIKWITGLSIIT